MTTPRWSAVFLACFLVGAALRGIDVWRPVDGSIRNDWREADVAAMARNFYREGMDIRYPRIDWRGRGPGYVESEFPLYPWTVAWLYRAFGLREELARVLSYLFSLAALGVFIALARHLLSPFAAAGATLFYVLSPMEIRLATAIQPEPLMLLAYLTAAWGFIRWIEGGGKSYYVLALAATALAVLTKAPAVHIGLFYLALLLHHHGLQAFRRPAVWAFAALSLLPAAAWYLHAHSFWLTYGNSAGVSNGGHWIGWDFLAYPSLLWSILAWDIRGVWTAAGVLLAALAVVASRRERGVRYALYWFGAAFIFYFVAARTAGARWALYYHIFSLVPAALLFGAGVQAIRRLAPTRRSLAAALSLAALATLLLEAQQVIRDVHPHVDARLYACAKRFAPRIPRGALLLASGGRCRNRITGRPVAYNTSYMFYWLDRKGYNICLEQQSVPAVRAFADSGASYFVAEKGAVRFIRGTEAALRSAFPVVAECPAALLLDISPAGRKPAP